MLGDKIVKIKKGSICKNSKIIKYLVEWE